MYELLEIESLEKILRSHVGDEVREIVRVDPSEDTTTRFEKEKWCIETAKVASILGPVVLGLGM